MTPQDVARVQALIDRTDLDVLSEAFYARLFVAHPELRHLFPDDIEHLRTKFAAELRAILDAIADLDAFVDRAHQLGARHAGYGVTTRDYESVGDVLADTFLAVVDGVTPDDITAWRSAYTLVAETMMEGASTNPFAWQPEA